MAMPVRQNVAPAKSPERHWRIHLVQIALYLTFIIIFLRLVQIQALNYERYQEMGEEQYTHEYTHKAARGLILDRNGTTLAFNKLRYDVGADTRAIEAPRALAARLAPILKKNENALFARLVRANGYAVLARGIEEEQAKVIELLRLPGVKVSRANDRTYPFQEKLAQVIGFADIDGNGLSGIELQFDQLLRGYDGWSLLQKDARGKQVMPIASRTKESKRGANVVLTIDQVLQTVAEEELQHAVTRFNAKSGVAVITNPGTGEILSMASAPTFDANQAKTKPQTWRIRAITDIFEPGSTFKIVTMMAGLTSGKWKMDDIVFCENGRMRILGEVINDSEKHGWLSFRNVFKHSSNIGTAKIAQKIDKRELFKAARDFGFGVKTGIELPGEVSGILKPPTEWSDFTPVAMSYGHEVAATALQMAMAYGAVANGGMLMQPKIVKEVHDAEGKVVYRSEPQVIRQVMEPRIAEQMTDVLVDVVEEGTGNKAKIEGIRIAGKTGTAQKPNVGQRGYSNSKYIASFVGFYPAERAQLLIYVALDEPFPTHSGGSTAAPTVRRMLERITRIHNKTAPPRSVPIVEARKVDRLTQPVVPNLAGRDLVTAQRILDDLGVHYTLEGEGDVVQSQEVSNEESNKPELILHLSSVQNKSEHVVMPDVTGMALRKAIAELSLHGLAVKVVGSGEVVNQQPEPGDKIRTGARCYLECQPAVPVRLLTH